MTSVIELADGRLLFIKRDSGSGGRSTFAEEAAGVSALAQAPGPRVPEVYAYWDGESGRYLLMEYIPTGSGGPAVQERLGRELAELHRDVAANQQFGFSMDNFIGATEQPNPFTATWIEFFGVHRLRFQAHLALQRGRLDRATYELAERLIAQLPQLIDEPAHPSLLHGDLWGGNYLATPDGQPVLIDPAVYYGHREADLAMTELFGGFGRRFYSAYHEAYPLEPGYEQRRDIYNLYHLLNHLNLFGGSYRSSVQHTLSRYR